MGFTYLLGILSIGYLLLYRARLLKLAQDLKDAGKPRGDARGSQGTSSGPLLALAIHLLALAAFLALAWTMIAVLFSVL